MRSYLVFSGLKALVFSGLKALVFSGLKALEKIETLFFSNTSYPDTMESLTASLASMSIQTATKKKIIRRKGGAPPQLPVVNGVTILDRHDDYLWSTDKEGVFAVRCLPELHPSGFFLVTPTQPTRV